MVSVTVERICCWMMLVLSGLAALCAGAHLSGLWGDQILAGLQLPLLDVAGLQGGGKTGYQIFNRLEGSAWLLLSGLVFRRSFQQDSHPIEPVYAVAFLLFGVSDFVEAEQYPLWLLYWKGLNLTALLYCRSISLRLRECSRAWF